MYTLLYAVLTMANGFALYRMVRDDIKWKKKFAELNAPMPKHLRAVGYGLKMLNAMLCAWTFCLFLRYLNGSD